MKNNHKLRYLIIILILLIIIFGVYIFFSEFTIRKSYPLLKVSKRYPLTERMVVSISPFFTQTPVSDTSQPEDKPIEDLSVMAVYRLELDNVIVQVIPPLAFDETSQIRVWGDLQTIPEQWMPYSKLVVISNEFVSNETGAVYAQFKNGNNISPMYIDYKYPQYSPPRIEDN